MDYGKAVKRAWDAESIWITPTQTTINTIWDLYCDLRTARKIKNHTHDPHMHRTLRVLCSAYVSGADDRENGRDEEE